MYKSTVISGNNLDISTHLRSSLAAIDGARGEIVQVVQSQSAGPLGAVIVTITIIYKV